MEVSMRTGAISRPNRAKWAIIRRMPNEGRTTGQLDALLRAATGHAILLTEPSGSLTMFNEGAERLLGYPAADLIGERTPDLFFQPGQLAEAAIEFGVTAHYADVVAAAVKGDAAWTRDWRWLTAAGEPITVRLSVTAVFDHECMTRSYLAIGTDVTAEVQALTELSEAESKWRTLLDILPGTAVLVLDDALQYQTALGEPLGTDRSEWLVGSALREVMALADAVQIEVVARAALAGHQRSADAQFNSGKIFTLAATPLQDHRGRPLALIIAHDVTVDRERERSLRLARERFQRLFDEAPTGTALVTLTGDFMQVNPTLGSLLGRDPSQIVGRHVSGIGASDNDEAEIRRYITDLVSVRTGRLTGDWTVRGQSGQLVYLSAAGVVLLDGLGQPESILINLLDISQRRIAEQRMAHLAHHDPLTGLANRRRFDAELTAHLDRCRRYGAAGAVMFLDLDHFKQVNDTMGHAAGDQLIVAVADALRARLRTSDVVARMGGDEFAILLPNVDREAAQGVAESVVRLIREEVQVFDAGTAHAVTTSVGVVLIDRTDVSTAELMVSADLTMYEAKEAGRDQYAIAAASSKRATAVTPTAAPSWADRIATALGEQRLLLHAQPLFDMRTRRCVGAELLVRMLYGDNELILPERFLYVAERAGLMPSVDGWVIDQAIDWLGKLAPSSPDFQLHVNLSALSMSDDDLIPSVQRRVMGSGIDPSRLVFEVTETAAASRLEAARNFSEAASQLGCELALGDFGAGFGSFYYLKHLSFHTIKVSGDLVTKSAFNRTDRMILVSVLDLARGLDKRIVAERVEDSTMLDAVRRQKIDFVQGYHLGMPQPVEDLLAPIIDGEAGMFQLAT
jgi:diguanylate cyclase (GGDEF)-like protein/PAS domain S-box-containing protein